MLTLIVAAIAFVAGVLFGRKNVKYATLMAAEANTAAIKANRALRFAQDRLRSLGIHGY